VIFFQHDFVMNERLCIAESALVSGAGGQLENMRLNMTSNLKIILSAVGVAALLASSAMAKTERHQQATSPLVNVPADARASVGTPLVTPYAPDVKVQANPTSSINPDFQLGSDK